ncbi:MAG: excinuclease ABC subunit UvrC [Euryarchaeota archaeon]|jgi:excinuclease ABC subunit C|nr:excinuclease ABC subunit UvrC [Euryarchaeota archaeon]MBT5254988.1 excinuclease ABC subunit UvrC [Euryarchaeota archaeon]
MGVDLATVNLPKKPGVYLFKSSEGRVLYVGKATKLNERIRSYFATNPDRAMIPKLVRAADDIECIVTNTPQEALVLERQLIRQHKPRYNSMLKDDKSYPFLVLTDHEIPRIMYTRNPPEKGQRWGPLPNAGAAKQVMQLLRKQFGIRDCKELLPQGCLSMHIGLCSGPCIDSSGYADSVSAARRVLDGDANSLLDELANEMENRSENMNFEGAAAKRDLIRAVHATTKQHVVSSKVYRDCDAIGISSEGDLAAVVVLHADEGVVKGQEVWPLVFRGDIGESVDSFITEHYQNRRPPRLLIIPTPLLDGTQQWLDERRGSKVDLRIPSRGDLVTLANLARQNSEIQLTRLSAKTSGSLEQRAADDGAKTLGLERLDYVVCFDMAQLLGDERVGVSVVLRNGRPAKKEYRKYIVKGDAIDDLRMMQEVVKRWIKRQDEWPDLLLLDGGQTHLSTITKMLEENKVLGLFPVAALAKKEETIHRLEHQPLVLDRMGRVMVHARDEAHRFVNTYHRKRRGRARLSDPLTQVDGLGAKKMQALLRHFGGRQEIVHATVEQLQTVPGIGNSLAKRIHQVLQLN